MIEQVRAWLLIGLVGCGRIGFGPIGGGGGDDIMTDGGDIGLDDGEVAMTPYNFMFVTSTLALRTRFLARWIAVLGYAIAPVLILSSRYVEWQLLAFPLWVLLVSLYILWDSGIQRR